MILIEEDLAINALAASLCRFSEYSRRPPIAMPSSLHLPSQHDTRHFTRRSLLLLALTHAAFGTVIRRRFARRVGSITAAYTLRYGFRHAASRGAAFK